jgi:hypothetical protein
MAGAWEIRDSNLVVCGILHTEVTTMAWSLGFRNLQIPGPVLPLTGMPFDHARNVACQKALEIGAQYIFFLDSDVVPPHDAIYRLISHRQPIISGVYCRRSPPVAVPVLIRNGTWFTVPPNSGIVEIDLVGAGCLLIHRSLLESLPPQRPGKRWFDWRVDMQGILPPGECLSEDFTYCQHVRRHGHKVLCDTSIQCRHIGYGEATYGQFKPLETIPVT